MIFFSAQAAHSVTALMTSPMDQAKKMIEVLGPDKTGLLLRHAAEEKIRAVQFNWERAEIPLALVLLACLYLGTQKRIFPIVLCLAMLVLVLFQHFGIAAELSFRGRETDFPPGNAQVGPVESLRALQAIYYGTEIIKLIMGGILASYLFVFRSSRRSNRKEVHSVDYSDDRHVNR
jgi:uncharacterized membrane protein affecting hemolysin expression